VRIKKRVWAAFALIVLVSVVALASYAGLKSAEDDYEWARVERRDLVLGIGVSGTLDATESATLGPPSLERIWSYRIAFMAPEGSTVSPGQPVLAFDASELQQQLQQRIADRDSAQKEMEKKRVDLERRRREAELQLAEAEARQRRAELQLETPQDLVADHELAKQRIDFQLATDEIDYLRQRLQLLDRQARAEIGSLEDRRAQAASRVTELESQIGRMQVTAPRGGIVIYTTSWNDEKSKVGDNVFRGNAVLEIPDLDNMRGSGVVDEADVSQLTIGQTVTLRLDAHPDVEYAGRISEVGRSVLPRSPGDPVKVVKVEIELTDTDTERMRPGMRFRGKVETERIADALLVPADAVLATAAGPVVYVDGTFGPKAVEPVLGDRTERWIEVESGLAEGDRVLLDPATALDDSGARGGSFGSPSTTTAIAAIAAIAAGTGP
jgi:HlyD family secretion protein